jgi:hypothetical protein
MLDSVKQFLKAQDWQFSQLGDDTLLLGVSGRNGIYQCIIQIDTEKSRALVYSVAGTSVHTSRQAEMTILLNRLNIDRFMGNFELYPETGEVRFRTSLYYGTLTPDNDVLEKLILVNLGEMDTAYPAIQRVVTGTDSKEAFSQLAN